MKLLLSFLLLTALTWQALALAPPPDSCNPPPDSCNPPPSCPSNAAPCDQIARCVTDDPQYRHTYPCNWTVLMDSINYLELIDDRDGVWQRQDVDGTGTTWQQAGGICGHEVSVCETGTNRNNWFFTQYISYLDAREVIVNVTHDFTGCIDDPRFGDCQPDVTFHRYERDNINAAAARDPNNYGQLRVVTGTAGFGVNIGITVFRFLPSSSNSRGVYIGAQDTGSCISIRRLTIYYRISPGRIEGVTVIPEIALPPQGSTERSTGCATCLDNAVPAPGTSLDIECDANGVCTDDPECVCSRGYEFVAATGNSAAFCRACSTGEYQARDSNDFSCQLCPANSEARDPATAVCECEFNFNRPADQPDEPCTRPPSSPRVAINNPPTVSGTSITVCWLPSLETGGRSDLHYNIYLLQNGGGSNAYQLVLTEDSNTNANPNTPLCRTLRNLTPGASYSVVITAANGATDDPDSFTDISVVQDRFIVFYVATGPDCDDVLDPPSSPRFSTTIPVISNTSITVCWLPSLDTGRGSNLRYNIYLLQFGDGSNAYQLVLTVNSSITANPNVALCRTIQNLTPESSYSVVISAANNATIDPNSFADVSVVQDRFIAFYFETGEDEEPSIPSPSPSVPPSSSPSVPPSPFLCPSSSPFSPPGNTGETEDDEGLSLGVVISILIFTLLLTAIVTAFIVSLIAWCLHKRSVNKYDVSSRKNGTTNGSSLTQTVEMKNPAYGY